MKINVPEHKPSQGVQISACQPGRMYRWRTTLTGQRVPSKDIYLCVTDKNDHNVFVNRMVDLKSGTIAMHTSSDRWIEVEGELNITKMNYE